MNVARRQRWHLALRDLGAASAFGSIAASGSVPLWTVGVFAVGFSVALSGRRPLAGRSGWAAALLAVAAVALFGSAFSGGLDLVVAACSFAACVAVARVLAEPSGRTDHQVHLTSLLMIAGGAALSGELLFGVFLVAFAGFGTLSLGLSVVDSAAGEEEVPSGPLVRRLGAGAALATAGAVAFFVLFPRVSWNLAGRRSSPGLGSASTGFSDRVRLGGSGTLKTNPRVVLRATLFPDPATDQLNAYWVGRTFDFFSGREWVGLGRARRPAGAVTLGPSSRAVVSQKIELLPAYDARTLVALDTPIMFANAVARRETGTQRSQLSEVDGEEVHFESAAVSYEYQAYSRQPGTGLPSRFESPADLERYRRLPPQLDPRVPALARRLIAGEVDPLRAAKKLEVFLQREYRYTLELPGSVEDPLSDFLFVRKAGHCEHFATALAVLLRTQGFASRVAAGFFGGQRLRSQYILRAGDAHAWTQVFVPGRGFVSVDATPPANRAASPSLLLSWLVESYELIESFWRSSVIDYSFQDQLRLARTLVRPPENHGATVRWKSPPREAWWAAALTSLVVYLVWRTARRAAAKPQVHPASSLREQIARRLEWAGLAGRGEELEDTAARLSSLDHELAPVVQRAVRRYLEARFGARPLDPVAAKALLRMLDESLARSIRSE